MNAVELEARLSQIECEIHEAAADLETPPRVVARELAELAARVRRLRAWVSGAVVVGV